MHSQQQTEMDTVLDNLVLPLECRDNIYLIVMQAHAIGSNSQHLKTLYHMTLLRIDSV